jgi:uncharacterized repeat protein (TIGR03803 family)
MFFRTSAGQTRKVKISKRTKGQKLAKAVLLDRLESRVLFSGGFVPITLANFGSATTAPQGTSGSLVEDSKGDIFGTTTSGGADFDGTVFEISAGSPGTVMTVATFTGATTGSEPQAGLSVDSNGNLYGTTSAGGANGAGTVFEIPASSLHTLIILGSFAAGSNVGATFTAGGSGLVIDASGNVYGTTASGGANGTGSIWMLAAGSSNVNNVGGSGSSTTLASFAPFAGTATFTNTTGANPDPYEAMVLSNGVLYGTTDSGGSLGDGGIFSLPTASSTIVNTASFLLPIGPFEGSLVMDTRGDLFGASTAGGGGDGTIFEEENASQEITAEGLTGTVTSVLSFTGANGQTPEGPLTLDANGDIFGTTTAGGGTGNDGTVFEVADGSGQVTTLDTFTSPAGTRSGVVEDGNGDLFGATQAGGANGTGTVFELIPAHLVITGVPTQFNASPNVIAPTVTIEGPTNSAIAQANFTVTLSVNQNGTLSYLSQTGTAVTAMASSGAVTFTGLSVAPAASGYTLTANDSNGDTFTNSVTFTVIPQPQPSSTKLAFTTQPAANTGTLAAVVVSIENSSGGVVTSDDSLVTISLASGPGTLGGTLSAQAVNGNATFTGLTVSETGLYTLTAIDGGLTQATSQTFADEPTAVHLVFGGLPTLFAESPATISPTVTLENSSNAVVTGEDTTVTLAISNGGSLSFDTAVSVNGVATFTGLKVTGTGSLFTLTATDGNADPAVVSGFFTVAPAPNASSNKLAFITQPTNNTGTIPAVSVAIENSSGQIVTADDSLVTISKATSPGTLGGTLIAQAHNGVVTFAGLTLNDVDLYHLIASDAGLTSATSIGFNVVAVPTSLTITSGPSAPLTAGVVSAMPVVVQALDQFGDTVNSGKATIDFTVVNGIGTTVSSGTAKEVNGIATFSKLKLDTAGTFTLVASSKGVLAGTKTITVQAAAAASMAFVTSVPQTTAGAPFGVTVELLDKFGNVATGDTSSVTLSLFGKQTAALDGTLTVAVTDGMAIFSDLSITKAGTYQIVATDSLLKKTIKTGSFTVG